MYFNDISDLGHLRNNVNVRQIRNRPKDRPLKMSISTAGFYKYISNGTTGEKRLVTLHLQELSLKALKDYIKVLDYIWLPIN